MRASNHDWVIAAVLVALAAPLEAEAETYGFKIAENGACTRDPHADAATPADAVVVKLARPAGAAQSAELVSRSEGVPDTVFQAEPGGAAEAASFKVHKSIIDEDATLLIRDPTNDEVRCPAVPLPGAGDAIERGPRLVDVPTATWWQKDGSIALELLRKRGGYPRGTQFLVHFGNGEPAPPFPAALSERAPIQIVVVTRPGAPLSLALSVTSCEKLLPFRVRGLPPPGAPQADRVATPVLVAFGPLLRCGAGTFSYSLGVDGSREVRSIRVRAVDHLAFTTAYGFDFTRVPGYAVQEGMVTGTADRAGLGLRLGFTWFPFGIDYEDMRWFNYVSPVFAFDPESPTESFLAGGAITPTGGLSLLVGASFRRITVTRGVSVGESIAGTEVPIDREWRSRGIGLYIGLSVDDDVFKALGSRIGQ